MLKPKELPAGNLVKKLLQSNRRERGIVGDADDSRLIEYLESTLAMIEAATDRCFEEQVWLETFTGFETYFDLTKSPVKSIEAVTYVDEAGATQDYEDFELQYPLYLQGSKVKNTDYPYGQLVEVEYTCEWNPIPPQLKQLVKHICGHWDNQREGVVIGTITKEVEYGIQMLMKQIQGKGFYS